MQLEPILPLKVGPGRPNQWAGKQEGVEPCVHPECRPSLSLPWRTSSSGGPEYRMLNWSHNTHFKSMDLPEESSPLAAASKQTFILPPSCRVCFLSPFSCGLRVLCFPSLWVCLDLVPWHRSPWPGTEVERHKHRGKKTKTKQKKGCSCSISNPSSLEWESYEKASSHKTPGQEVWISSPRICIPPPTKILMVLEEHGSLALLAAGACRGAQHPQAGSWSRHLGRQPGQRCSTKPSSLHVALAAITFPMSFAAASHLANAFPQLSDFKVVRGHFAPEQTPLKTPGSVSIPSSKHLLPAFSPCPAAGSQW